MRMSAEQFKQESDVDINTAAGQLHEYGEAHGLRGLEGRVNRGLDPTGMLALPQTRRRIENLADAYGADMADVEKLVNDLHVGGVWAHASELAAGSPAATVWTVAGEATVRDKAVLGDLTAEQFSDDSKRVIGMLDEAVADPTAFARVAHENLIGRSQERFTVEDGVPVSDVPEGFLAMAVNGYKGGIVRDVASGLMFVGGGKIDFDRIAEGHNLTAAQLEDRGRVALFYVDSEQERHIKQLYPGFGIVLDGDMALAKDLASTAAQESEA